MHGTVRPGGAGQKYALVSDEDENDFWGFAREAEGLFTPLRDEEGEGEGDRRVRLVGCLPQGGLMRSVGHVGGRRAVAGNGYVAVLGPDGDRRGLYFVGQVTVVDVRPSALGAGLVDLVVTLWCDEAEPGSDTVWDLVRSGRLDRTGLWHGLSPADRWAWLSVALKSHGYPFREKYHSPADRVYAVDGRYVVDRNSFYCAIGEAVNGPGGCFGWNLDALDDCLRGGWGAAPGFTLHWEDSARARERLVERLPSGDGETSLFETLLAIFEERGVDVVLR